MAHPTDICPRCEGQTEYGPVKDGGEGLYCTRCDWQAVTVNWVAVKASQVADSNKGLTTNND